MIRRITGIVLLMLCGQVSLATVVFSGGEVRIEGPINDNVLVTDGSTVTIGSNGLIAGVGSGTRNAAIQTLGHNNTVTIEGTGRVVASPGQSAIFSTTGRHSIHIQDEAVVVGNIDSDTANGGWDREETANQRLYIHDRAVINGSVTYVGYIHLDGQAAILGDLGNSTAETSINIDGGVVTGRVMPGGLVDHDINISGGAILGGIDGRPSWVDMTMTGGYIGGTGIRTVGDLNADIYDGQIDGGIHILGGNYASSSRISLFGGQVDAAVGGWLIDISAQSFIQPRTSLLEIWGGHFGYNEDGLGIRLDHYTDFHIYGRDLLFVDGLLSGYLSDGSWFSSALTFGENWRGAFTIHNVPEPGTLGLFSLVLLGAALARRKRAQA